MPDDRDGVDRLRDAIWLRVLDQGVDESYSAMCGALCAYYAGAGTRGATAVAVKAARAGWLVGEGYSEQDAAVMVGVGLRSVQRYVEDLKGIYGVARHNGSGPA